VRRQDDPYVCNRCQDLRSGKIKIVGAKNLQVAQLVAQKVAQNPSNHWEKIQGLR
jgi:hypothetical protein